MITVGKDTYLVATEAAKELKVSRVTFYKRYRRLLQAFRIGELRRAHYKLSDVAQLNSVEPMAS
jgi:hypothetical protein